MTKHVAARWTGALIGAWLFVSAFAWQHSPEQFYNSWVVGLSAFIAAVLAANFDWTRYANIVMAVWLLASVWALPVISDGTFWNNIVVAVLMFAVAMAPRPPHLRSKNPPGKRPVDVGAG